MSCRDPRVCHGSSGTVSDVHDLLHHVNRGHLLNIQITFNQLQNVKLVAPIRFRRRICLIQTFARLSV